MEKIRKIQHNSSKKKTKLFISDPKLCQFGPIWEKNKFYEKIALCQSFTVTKP